jgi:heavy metal sensor kinase
MSIIHSITFRLTLWYLAILGIMLTLLGSGVYFSLSRVLYDNLDDSLKTRAEQMSKFRDIMSIVAGGTFEEEIGELISFYFYSDGQLMHISHKQFKVPVSKEEIDSVISDKPVKSLLTSLETSQNGKLRVFITPFKPDNPDIRPERFSKRRPPPSSSQSPPPPPPPPRRITVYRAALVIARPMRDIETALNKLLQILLTAIPLTLLFSGGGGVFLAKRAFKPVERITDIAREIGESDLSRRIDIKTKDELGKLASALNLMIERLEKAFARQQQFTGDASHELRTPLAVIQAESTLSLQKERSPEVYQKSIGIIAQEAGNMSAIINQMLTLARADSGKAHLKFEEIALSEFIREICYDVEILCREKQLALNTDLSDNIFVRGDKKSLVRLMYNLISNAVRYTDEGGTVSVLLYKERENAVIAVKDTGIGIPSDALSLIFERFYRVDKARSRSEGGTGLGLAICKHIAEAHKGSIEVESLVGKGSAFYVKFPKVHKSEVQK